MKRHRVLLGLTEIAGYYRGLREGFRELGVEVVFLNLSGHPFAYGGDDENVLVRLIRRCSLKRSSPRAGRLSRGLWGALEATARCALLAWAAARFDVFIFGFATSFLRFRDLPILKRLGKRIVYQFHGSDSRPPYLDGGDYPPDQEFSAAELIDAARRRKRRLRTIEKYADVLINIPPQSHFHERVFVQWLRVGLPSRPAEAPAVAAPPGPHDGPVRILHSPSHPAAKGTPAVRRAVEKLKADGLDLELIEIVGRPNAEVMREMARCDLVIDQAYSDYAMPGLATEAAWFARPVVIAGYAAGLWRRLLPEDARPPTLYCQPDELTDAIRKLATDAELRRELGMKCRRFVETHWSPRQVAAKYLRLIEGDVPADWLCDPKEIDYLAGCSLPEQVARRRVRQVIEAGGVEALQLADKPELERRLVRFARDG